MAIGPRRRRFTEGRTAISIIKDSCVTRRNDPHAPVAPLSADASRLEKATYCTLRSQPAIVVASFAILFVIAVFGELPTPHRTTAPSSLSIALPPLTTSPRRRRGGAPGVRP